MEAGKRVCPNSRNPPDQPLYVPSEPNSRWRIIRTHTLERKVLETKIRDRTETSGDAETAIKPIVAYIIVTAVHYRLIDLTCIPSLYVDRSACLFLQRSALIICLLHRCDSHHSVFITCAWFVTIRCVMKCSACSEQLTDSWINLPHGITKKNNNER